MHPAYTSSQKSFFFVLIPSYSLPSFFLPGLLHPPQNFTGPKGDPKASQQHARLSGPGSTLSGGINPTPALSAPRQPPLQLPSAPASTPPPTSTITLYPLRPSASSVKAFTVSTVPSDLSRDALSLPFPRRSPRLSSEAVPSEYATSHPCTILLPALANIYFFPLTASAD